MDKAQTNGASTTTTLDINYEDDERNAELTTVASIYPEFISTGPFSGRIEIEINPTEPVTVKFKLTDLSDTNNSRREEYDITHLPPLEASFSLPDEYPENKPPNIQLSSYWIDHKMLQRLKDELYRLWESLKDQSVFACIDTLVSAADELFQLPQPLSLAVPQSVKLKMLDFNSQMIKKKFDEGTFNCGVCMEPKKGAVCYKIHQCGHVFCKACLRDYYTSVIEEGEISNVHCLDYACGEDAREEVVGDDGVARRMPRKPGPVTPAELKDLVDEAIVERYLMLLRKRTFELNKDQVYCPRKFCGGPGKRDGKDRLAVCLDCGLAFCTDCGKTWHGYTVACRITARPKTKEEIENEKWLDDNSTKCPTCLVPITKSTGCNHMICSKCNTHFCLLCGAFLWASNPYQHFNDKWSFCYQRLWEGLDLGAANAGPNLPGQAEFE